MPESGSGQSLTDASRAWCLSNAETHCFALLSAALSLPCSVWLGPRPAPVPRSGRDGQPLHGGPSRLQTSQHVSSCYSVARHLIDFLVERSLEADWASKAALEICPQSAAPPDSFQTKHIRAAHAFQIFSTASAWPRHSVDTATDSARTLPRTFAACDPPNAHRSASLESLSKGRVSLMLLLMPRTTISIFQSSER